MTTEPSRAVKLCGTEEIDPPSRLLRAGPLSAEFENGQSTLLLQALAHLGV